MENEENAVFYTLQVRQSPTGAVLMIVRPSGSILMDREFRSEDEADEEMLRLFKAISGGRVQIRISGS